MSSDVQSTDNLRDVSRKRRKISKASRSSRRRSSQHPPPSPRASKSISIQEENAEPLEHSRPQTDPDTERGNAKRLNNSLLGLLDDIKEDVVTSGQINGELLWNSRLDVESVLSSTCSDIHQTYVQTQRGFRPLSQDQKTTSEDDPNTEVDDVNYFTKTIQKTWTTFSTLCHGFLGGVSVTHLILIWAIDPGEWPLVFIRKYAAFVEVFGNTFYFLATVCMVSVLDRMDVACFRVNKRRSLLWLVILLIYATTLLLSLACDSLDTRLYLGGFNVTIDEDEIRIRKLFSVWNNFSVGRSIGGILGWLVLGSVSREE